MLEEISELLQTTLDVFREFIVDYGLTECGKTYTMLGEHCETGTKLDAGLGMIRRAVRQLLDSAKIMEIECQC